MAVAFLLMAIAVALAVVRIGAVAFELTGVPWEHAKFQALSAFTNAGFTTRESEEITRHPLRRRIASFLIVTGNAGLIATVASFVTSLSQPQPIRIVANLFAIAIGIVVLGWVASRPAVTRRLHEHARQWFARRYPLESWTPDELLHLDEGYVLTRFAMSDSSQAAGRTLRQLRLKQNGIEILAVERGTHFHAVPGGDFRLAVGDEVIVYGVRKAVEQLLQPGEDQDFLIIEDTSPGSAST